jgi:hypothetical protein
LQKKWEKKLFVLKKKWRTIPIDIKLFFSRKLVRASAFFHGSPVPVVGHKARACSLESILGNGCDNYQGGKSVTGGNSDWTGQIYART